MKSRVDTLLVFPTIGANAADALLSLGAVKEHWQVPHDTLLVMDEFDALPLVSDAIAQIAASRMVPPIMNLSPKRRGLVGAFNVGFREFLADKPYQYMMWLEDHITVTPGWDTTMRRVLENHPQFGWVACGQIENTKAPFTSMCSMMTLEAARAAGGLDEQFAPAHFDDADLFLRLMQAGFTPQAVDVRVSHPKARTSLDMPLEHDQRLSFEHMKLFQKRWGIRDWDWSQVPVHRCAKCDG